MHLLRKTLRISAILSESQRVSLHDISTKQAQALVYSLKCFTERFSRFSKTKIPQSSKSILNILKHFDLALFDAPKSGLIACGESKSYKGKLVHLGSVPVTQGLYCEITGKSEEALRAFISRSKENFKEFMGKLKPVHGLSFLDAIEFCNLLSERMGLDKCYDILKLPYPKNLQYGIMQILQIREHVGDEAIFVMLNRRAEGFRLPTIAEWGMGFFGAEESAYLKKYERLPLDYLQEHGWIGLNSSFELHNVAEKKPNSLGFYDMVGNVFQYSQEVFVDSETRDDENEQDEYLSYQAFYSDALNVYFSQKKSFERVADSEPYYTYPAILGADFLSVSSEAELMPTSDSLKDESYPLNNSSILARYVETTDSPRGCGVEYYSERFGGDLSALYPEEKAWVESYIVSNAENDRNIGPRFSEEPLAYVGFRIVLAYNK